MTRIKSAASSVTGGAFASQVSAITSAFGDPTRRAVYVFVRDAAQGVTASQVAERFDVHPNVARHHLDKLAAGGYLEVEVARAEHAGAGRPSKRYRPVTTTEPMQFPVRSDDLVLSLLGEALERLPRDAAEAMAEEVGRKYGHAMAAGLTGDDVAAGQRSLRSALQR
ncbi:MAG: helix-turn-helix transcriptional regulator, partial [Ilumatobacteraceae bacterium]